MEELRRVRDYLGLSRMLVSVATGVSMHRLAGAETGRLELNPTEKRALDEFYQDKIRILRELKQRYGGEV